MISITYKVSDYSNGYQQYERTFTVPNYKTLRSLLSAVDAACMEIELQRNDFIAESTIRKGVDL
jgi:hypothetical protein